VLLINHGLSQITMILRVIDRLWLLGLRVGQE
jgi:hypothetical protein